MSVSVYIRLFDMRAYETKVLPACEKFLQKNNPEPLIDLTREAIANTSVRGKREWRYSALKEGTGILDDSKLIDPGLKDLLYSRQKWEDAVRNGRIREFLKQEKGAVRRQGRNTSLKDKKLYVSFELASALLFAVCTPRIRGLNVEQNMSKTALYYYLIHASEWIQDVFCHGRKIRGGYLKYPMGQTYAVIFSDEDITEFRQALCAVTNPEKIKLEMMTQGDKAQLRKDFNNLNKMLKLVSENSHLKLVQYYI